MNLIALLSLLTGLSVIWLAAEPNGLSFAVSIVLLIFLLLVTVGMPI